jgi:hypothetical protein
VFRTLVTFRSKWPLQNSHGRTERSVVSSTAAWSVHLGGGAAGGHTTGGMVPILFVFCFFLPDETNDALGSQFI